jgi:arylsulfatase A-like enzyme
VQNLDFAQTFLDIAGAELPADMQGLSLVPLFNGNTKYWRDALYYHYYEYPGIHGVKRHYGISTSRYKLIHFYYDIDEWELYDLETDPGEMHNLIDDPKAENIKNALMKKLTTLRKEYGDSDELTMDILENDLKQ